MTEEQIQKCAHIPDAEILQDIEDTKKEINQYREEITVLMNNPQVNKFAIYTREGEISLRNDFINQCREILEYRQSKQQP